MQTFPNQNIPESEMDEDFYIRTINAISNYSYGVDSRFTRRSASFKENMEDYTIRQLYNYYFGEQENKTFKYLQQLDKDIGSADAWLPGQKISQLVDFMKGNLIEIIKNSQYSVFSSGKASEQQQKLYNREYMKLELKQVVDEIEKRYGVKPQPTGNGDFANLDQLNRWFEYDYKDEGQVHFIDIVDDITNQNRTDELLKRGALHAIIAGYFTMEVGEDKHGVYHSLIPPYESIIDTSVDSDYLSNRRFGGKVTYMTIDEIAERYNVTEDELDFLQGFHGEGNSPERIRNKYRQKYKHFKEIVSPNVTWHDKHGKIPMYAVSDCEWYSLKKIPYKKVGEYYERVDMEDTKPEDLVSVSTVRRGTLIGGCILKDYGEKENIVGGRHNDIKYLTFIPNMIDGRVKSVVARLAKHQDQIDAYSYKVNEAIRRDKGKAYAFDLSQIDENHDMFYVTTLLQANGIIPYNSEKGDEPAAPGQKFIEAIDLSLPNTVSHYINMILEEERKMNQIVNIPEAAQGQQRQTIGKGVQENVIKQSNTGVSWLYDSFIGFKEHLLQHTAEIAKKTYPKHFDMNVRLGDRGMKYLKVTEGSTWRDYGLFIRVNDILDLQDKIELKEFAYAAAQNDRIDMEDVANMMKARTFSEMKNDFVSARREKEEEQQRMAQMQAEMQQQEQQRKENLELQKEKMRQDGETDRTAMREGGSAERQAMSNDAKLTEKEMDVERER